MVFGGLNYFGSGDAVLETNVRAGEAGRDAVASESLGCDLYGVFASSV